MGKTKKTRKRFVPYGERDTTTKAGDSYESAAEARERGDAKAELVILSPGGQLVRFEKALTDG